MVLLSFLNLGLVVLYYIFASYDMAPVGFAGAVGITLAFLFNYLSKARPPSEVLLMMVATFVSIGFLYYSYTPKGVSILYFSFSTISAFFAAASMSTLPAFIAGCNGIFKYYKDISLIVMATCATAFNGLPLISYFWTIAAA